ncbi:hypothetical protein KM176_04525 [Pseudooceanicola sp. CBS1P-1]|uniref:Secreted protein n=1 Tax=Pseudooceanicola albus TaxID=2692189 RepID=A0A6L7G6J8_9RHOB|nr:MULTISPECIES: hypothetical protein [Pseudooceanicola]MBT9383114.1 hypothetical protein [Pseudooceanicola endophyticus]MXN19302.1 hypothetical protein [Pseudooceanicola albus]
MAMTGRATRTASCLLVSLLVWLPQTAPAASGEIGAAPQDPPVAPLTCDRTTVCYMPLVSGETGALLPAARTAQAPDDGGRADPQNEEPAAGRDAS